jgi:predicted ABC-type exoprotein transport system permease subunit
MRTKDMILLGFSVMTLFSSIVSPTIDSYFAMLMVMYLIFIFVVPYYLNKKTRNSLIIVVVICVIIILSIMINRYWSMISKHL